MKVVLDTTALIYLNDFSRFSEICTAPEVIIETKDQASLMKLEGLSNMKILDPFHEDVEEIKKVATTTGDIDKLSRTDIKVLALAKGNGSAIVSDDRNIQNVAEKIGLEYISVFGEKIKKLVTWKKFCRNCLEYFDADSCPICGSRLWRVMAGSKTIK